MKFWCGETWVAKRRRKKRWHLWFAWHPVCLENAAGTRQCWFWLEIIERQLVEGITWDDGNSWNWRPRGLK